MTTASLSFAAIGAAADAAASRTRELVDERFASRLFDQDATLWGADAQAEASTRLSWVDLPRSSRPLLGQIAALRDELAEAGVRQVVLCGMGGSSLAPEVICFNAGAPLTVLDSSDPDMVRAASADVSEIVVVISSKSGSTIETDSHRRIFVDAFTKAGIDPAQRIIFVTDPGSPLDQQARADGFTVVNADPQVGGRYSALTAFGLVPSGLAGADLEELLDQAEAAAAMLRVDDEGNPGLRLGAAIAGTDPLRPFLLLDEESNPLVGLGDWVEQLVAESTGKQGTGILPIVVDDEDDPLLEVVPSDATVVHVVPDVDDIEPVEDTYAGPSRIFVSGSLGAQMMLWEVATVAAGRLLSINPFDQPDVESAKEAAREVMGSAAQGGAEPVLVEGAIAVYTANLALADPTLEGALETLLDQVDDHSYLAVMAYLDRWALADLSLAREALGDRVQRPTSFAFGPRFLHSTGQFHKGGPRTGVYLQVTAEPEVDVPVPGKDYTLGELILAQAQGDAAVLADHGRPVLRLHLLQRDAGLTQLSELIGIPDPRESEES